MQNRKQFLKVPFYKSEFVLRATFLKIKSTPILWMFGVFKKVQDFINFRMESYNHRMISVGRDLK